MKNEIETLDLDINYTKGYQPCMRDNEIKVIHNLDVEYAQFFERFMINNKPCIIKNVCQDWLSSKNWVLNNHINWDYLVNNYGDLVAPVANCGKLEFNSQCKCTMTVKEYIEYLKQDNKQELLYLKDWHLKAKLKELDLPDNFYDVPKYFGSDWLNEYADDVKEDDFKFVYIGAKDTWTPLHVDVYSSYSWSVNVVGRKKWILFPPGEEDKLRDSLGNLPTLFNADNYEHVVYFDIIQEPGDAIFVPSGWHHQVFNLYDTISINHNFINSSNIEKVWLSLEKHLKDVEKEIEEFKNTPEFTSQCQLILKALFGMDFSSFINFIIHIAEKRVNQIQGKKFIVFNLYNFSNKHILFDLNILYKIFNIVENHSIFSNNNLLPNIVSKFIEVKLKICEIIK